MVFFSIHCLGQAPTPVTFFVFPYWVTFIHNVCLFCLFIIIIGRSLLCQYFFPSAVQSVRVSLKKKSTAICYWSVWPPRWFHLLNHPVKVYSYWKQCLWSFTQLIQSACRRLGISISSSSAAGSFGGQGAVCASEHKRCLTLALSLCFSLACCLQTSAPAARVQNSGWTQNTFPFPSLGSVCATARDLAVRPRHFHRDGQAPLFQLLCEFYCNFKGAVCEIPLWPQCKGGVRSQNNSLTGGWGRITDRHCCLHRQLCVPLVEPALVLVPCVYISSHEVARLERRDDGYRAGAQGGREEGCSFVQAGARNFGPPFSGCEMREWGPTEEGADSPAGRVTPFGSRKTRNEWEYSQLDCDLSYSTLISPEKKRTESYISRIYGIYQIFPPQALVSLHNSTKKTILHQKLITIRYCSFLIGCYYL